MKRLSAPLAALAFLVASAGNAQVVAPEIAPVIGAQSAPTPVISISPLSILTAPSLAVPALGVQFAFPAAPALPPAAASLAAVPALAAPATPALARAAGVPAQAPVPGALGEIHRAAAPLSDSNVDAAAHLTGFYDAAFAAPALSGAAISAASADAPRRPSSGLKRAATPSGSTFREHLSPEGNEARELSRLNDSLAANGLPSHRTTRVETESNPDRPTVVILAPASRHKIALAREGGRQAPGDVHLALDASWLTQEVLPDGRTKLLLKKGVTFDAHGQATVVEYVQPRVVRYFANFFTLSGNDREDGVPFEKNLDVPQSNSYKLESFVNDKLLTRLEMAAGGVDVPPTLALAMPENPLAEHADTHPVGGVTVAAMPQGDDRAARVAALVGTFLDHYAGDEVVVKPSGLQYHSGRGVRFFRKEQREEIAAYALALSQDSLMPRDGVVLIDGRVNSAPLDRGGRKMETTLRVIAVRTPWGGVKTTDMFARVGPWGKPTTAEAADPRDNATVEPIEKLMKEWGLGPREAGAFRARLERAGEATLTSLIKREKSLSRAEDDPRQAQTDMIGLDVMVERRGRELIPVVIEVNDHDSGGQYNLDALIATDRIGTHSREWVATMLQRARRDALRGKRIVIVGAGYEGKRFIFERAKELGVKIILIDKPTTWAKDLVSELIPTDNTKPAEALSSARKKLLASARKNGKIDGITTFWEDDVELTADIARELGLPYHTKSAASTARSKFETQEVLDLKGVPAARRVVVGNLSNAEDQSEHAAALERFRAAAARVGFPAVLKPVSGAAAVGTERVNSLDEAVAAYERISALINPKTDPIFSNNSDLLLMQYLDGREYDVDLVMRDGEVMFESIADNKPTREPSFLATGSRLPSILSDDEQRAAIDQAIASARALGLTDGVIHMEGKVTSEGPRLIEANARMGGSYVRDWVLNVWGVDMVEEGFMAAAGVKGKPFKPAAPLVHLDGDFLNADKPGIIRKLELPAAARKLPGFIRFREVMHVGEVISTEQNGGYARVAMLEVGGATAEEAARNLAAIKAKIKFVVDPLPQP